MKEEYLKSLQNILTQEEYKMYLASMQVSPKKSFRLNRVKLKKYLNNDTLSHSVLLDIITQSNGVKNNIIDTAYHINNSLKLGNEWYHKAGLIYIQEPSSMMAVECVKNATNLNGLKALDLCAAPGGKTSQLSECVGKNGFVLSNELNNKRVQILRSNVERLGLLNVAISSCDTSVISKNLQEEFDVVLIDAPCSGEGMFRKDANAQEEWSLGEVERNSCIQLQILNNASKCLKNGGYLVYSTCTFNTQENEQVVLNFLEQNKNFKIIKCDEKINQVSKDGIVLNGLNDLKYARRFYPFDGFGEGQFVCLMKKEEGENKTSTSLKSNINKQEQAVVEHFVKQNFEIDNFCLSKLGSTYFLHNGNIPNLKNVPLLTCGVAVCEIEKNIIKPHHNMFTAYGSVCKNKLELSCEDNRVNKFFKGEQIEGDVKDGFCAICVESFCVGFGKSKNGVINNKLPKGLRDN